ncbi:MAG: amidohydrolase family protein, partial [Tissierellia bacterium]|nr:amidohydrolase family protein [Tissierellia bacterium]
MQNKRMRKIISLFLIFGLVFASGTFSLAMNNPKATVSVEVDVIYINGNIYTKYVAGENTNSKFEFWGPYGEYEKASVIATSDQDIIYVGNSQAEAEALTGDNPRIVDLGGKTVIPGLVESHMHFMSEGTTQTMIDIFWKSKEDIIAEVEKEAQRYADRDEPTTTWIVSRGWVDTLEGWTPATAAELDEVSLGYPVFLRHASGHGGWANTAAMEVAGVDKNTPNPEGGTIVHG